MNSLYPAKHNKLFDHHKLSPFFIAILISGAAFNATAEEDAPGISIGADLFTEYDDNVFRNYTEQDDTALKFAPEVQYLAYFGSHTFKADYKGEYSAYSNNNDLNYLNHEADLFVKFDHTHRLNTEFSVGYKDTIEEPGTTNAAPIVIDEFNQFNQLDALARLYYGTHISTGQLVLSLAHKQQEYTNNLQSFRDVDVNSVTGTFFYRVAPKTRFLFETTFADYQYDDSFILNSNQSSTELRYLAGVEWEATAKTTGIFKLGYQDKTFDDNNFADVDGLSYYLDMIWKPNQYTSFTIGANRKTTESAQAGVGGYLSTEYKVGVNHSFTELTKMKASYSHITDDITSRLSRNDTRHAAKIGLSHNFLRWLEASLDYQFLKRDSDYIVYQFDANSVALGITATF